ncbi:MAG: hypothetical protein R2708_06865 [Vicinamibacterales bacterium]
MIRDLLHDPDLLTGALRGGTAERSGRGGDRGTARHAHHDYRVGGDDLITACNLIVSTTHNNEAMNRAVAWVADHVISGHAEVTEGMLNQVEVAIRAYDPA